MTGIVPPIILVEDPDRSSMSPRPNAAGFLASPDGLVVTTHHVPETLAGVTFSPFQCALDSFRIEVIPSLVIAVHELRSSSAAISSP